RYVIAELFSKSKLKFLSGKYIATGLAVVTAGAFAFANGAEGKGALMLWPMFGAVNQLLAALALIVLSIYLKQKGGLKYLVTLLPFIFMIVMTLWSIIINEINFINNGKWLLTVTNSLIFILALWMVVEALLVFTGKKQSS
ncbi:MAG TPA: carbon starvation CstA 5TM domain-containing protein, partial [Spirochaetota bacterium]|nr:carbon starvation CstA 5TM domain-containing protein [Spirochaetota bacterium]